MSTGKISAVIAAVSITALVIEVIFRLNIPPVYGEFIVGNLTWGADSKLQDIIFTPLVAGFFILFYVFFEKIIKQAKQMNGVDHDSEVERQLLLWSLPSVMAIASSLAGAQAERSVLFLSFFALIFIAFSFNSALGRNNNTLLQPLVIGSTGLAMLFMALLPAIVVLLAAKFIALPPGWYEKLDDIFLLLFAIGLFAGFWVQRSAHWAAKGLPRLLFLSQLGLPVFFLLFSPLKWLEFDGTISAIPTTWLFKLLVVSLIICAVVDVIHRYRCFLKSNDLKQMISPFAVMALVIFLKAGKEIFFIVLNPDDYHFGESLIGSMVYQQGFLPYIEYYPVHGIFFDDFVMFVNRLFLDGMLESFWDSKLIFEKFLSLVLFAVMLFFSRSLLMAALTALFSIENFYIIGPFILFLSARSLWSKPFAWLVSWVVLLPLLLIGIPTQSFVMIVASLPMAIYAVWRCISDRDPYRYTKQIALIIGIGLLTVLILATPLRTMLHNVLAYIVDSAKSNNVAYGMPWRSSWDEKEQFTRLIFEIIRMSWMASVGIGFYVLWRKLTQKPRQLDEILPIVFVLLVILMQSNYYMGRIDAVLLTRAGTGSIFAWIVFVPILLWFSLTNNQRVVLCCTIAFMCSLLVGVNDMGNTFARIKLPREGIDIPKKDMAWLGHKNIGYARIFPPHEDQLRRLHHLLNKRLTPEQTYLDLSSHNAHYYYMQRMPPVPITAPYNMLSEYQQSISVDRLQKNLPPLALLEAFNLNIDGGGLALRTHLLYRFVLDNYRPIYENGMIVGYPRSQVLETLPFLTVVSFKVMAESDPAHGWITMDDPVLASLLKVGDNIMINDATTQETYSVSEIDVTNRRIRLDQPLVETTEPIYYFAIVDPQTLEDYQTTLFARSVNASWPLNLKEIPYAWGKSAWKLKDRMSLVKTVDADRLKLVDLQKNGNQYTVNGTNPSITIDLRDTPVTGRDVGIISYDLKCDGYKDQVAWRMTWSSLDRHNFDEKHQLLFQSGKGKARLIVPLDASPWWLRDQQIDQLRIELIDSGKCHQFMLDDITFNQRKLLN